MIIGIMGAMPDEVDQLCARLENVTVEPYGGVEYHNLKISINWVLFIFFLLANLSITLSTQSETLVKAVLVLRVLSEDEVILHPFQPAVFDFQRLYYPVQ